MIDVSITVLIFTNVILLIILLMLFSYLLVRKNKDMNVKVRKEKLKTKLRTPLFNYLHDGSELKTRLFQKEPLSYEVTEELLVEFGTMIKGEEVTERIQKFAEVHFSEYFQELLQHKSWSIRMNTLYSIEDFQMLSLEPVVWKLFLEGTNQENSERHQLVRVLAKLQSRKLIEYLFSQSEAYPLFLYKEVLRSYQSELFDQVVSRYEKANDTLKIAILAIFAEKMDTSYLPLVEQELENGHTDIRLQALKVLQSFGYVRNLDTFVTFAKSSLWQERMLFCHIAAVLNKERFKSFLVDLIADQSWWVRNAAGKALASYQDGEIILAHISETHVDSFAKDMAQQWLGGEVVDNK